MKKTLVLMAVAALIGVVQELAKAQQEGKQDQPDARQQYEEVKVYHAVVIGDGTIEGAAKVVSIGPDRKNKADAEADEEQWKKDHPKSLRLTDVREKTIKTAVGKLMEAKEAVDKVKEAKEAVDKAKKIEKEGPLSALSEKVRKLGATLKEYGEESMKAMERAKEAKKGLTEMTGKISRKQFDEVNKLITNYNQSRDQVGRAESEFNAAKADGFKGANQPIGKVEIAVTGIPTQDTTSVLDRFPPMSPLKPEDFKGRMDADEDSKNMLPPNASMFEYQDKERGAKGEFRKSGSVWTNVDAVGQTYTFEEKIRTKNYVQMYDASRSFWMVFYGDGRSYMRIGNAWAEWYQIEWVQAKDRPSTDLAGTQWVRSGGGNRVKFGRGGTFQESEFAGTFSGTYKQNGTEFTAKGRRTDDSASTYMEFRGRITNGELLIENRFVYQNDFGIVEPGWENNYHKYVKD